MEAESPVHLEGLGQPGGEGAEGDLDVGVRARGGHGHWWGGGAPPHLQKLVFCTLYTCTTPPSPQKTGFLYCTLVLLNKNQFSLLYTCTAPPHREPLVGGGGRVQQRRGALP